MHHPFKGYAKAVQMALESDVTLARPNYQWCLSMVERYMPAAREGAANRQAIIDRLLDVIRPFARKAG